MGLHGMEGRGNWFVWPIIREGFRQWIDLPRPGSDMFNDEKGGIKSSFVKKGDHQRWWRIAFAHLGAPKGVIAFERRRLAEKIVARDKLPSDLHTEKSAGLVDLHLLALLLRASSSDFLTPPRPVLNFVDISTDVCVLKTELSWRHKPSPELVSHMPKDFHGAPGDALLQGLTGEFYQRDLWEVERKLVSGLEARLPSGEGPDEKEFGSRGDALFHLQEGLGLEHLCNLKDWEISFLVVDFEHIYGTFHDSSGVTPYFKSRRTRGGTTRAGVRLTPGCFSCPFSWRLFETLVLRDAYTCLIHERSQLSRLLAAVFSLGDGPPRISSPESSTCILSNHTPRMTLFGVYLQSHQRKADPVT
eukprot:Gb_10647 [translate_table: standard]